MTEKKQLCHVKNGSWKTAQALLDGPFSVFFGSFGRCAWFGNRYSSCKDYKVNLLAGYQILP